MAQTGSTKDVKKMIRERKKNDLPLGMIKAIRHAKLRLPPDASPVAEALNDQAVHQITRVMDAKISYRQAPTVLKASTYIHEMICGPLPKEINVTGQLSLLQLLAKVEDGTAE